MAWSHIDLVVSGLNGGHSGMDIHRGLGNANKIMNRILLERRATRPARRNDRRRKLAQRDPS